MDNSAHHLIHGHLDHHTFDHSHQSHADDHLDFKNRKKQRNTRHRKKLEVNDGHDEVLHLFDHDHGPEVIMHHAMPMSMRAVVSQMKMWVQRSYVKTKVAVLVSDLSGFTATTRKYGIVHFASIIIRMRQLCLPILHHYHALHIGTEADNLIVVFRDAVGAARAAYEMQHVLQAYRYSLDADRSHFKVNLNGIGLAYGAGVIVDREGKLHGEVANAAYHMGEDLCDHGSILMTEDVVNAIKDSSAFADARYDEFTTINHDKGLTMGPVFRLLGHVDYVHKLADTSDMRFLHQDLELLCRRHRKGVDLAKVDDLIRQKFMKKMTAVMFEIDFSEIEKVEGAEAGLVQKFMAIEMLKPILDKYNAITLEDVLHVFEDPTDAILCCAGMQDKIRAYNKGKEPHIQLQLTGKLGQDIAVGGEILITTPVYKAVETKTEFRGTQFIPRKFIKSHVEFTCYAVHMPFDSGVADRPAHPAMKKIDQREYQQFSVSTQCDLGGKTSVSSRPQGIRPKAGIFGLPSGARDLQRFPDQIGIKKNANVGRLLAHNMMSREQPFTLRPKPDTQIPYQRPNHMTHTTAMRRKDEYERTVKHGLGQLGEKNDAIVLYPGSSGGHPVVVSPKKPNYQKDKDVKGMGSRILHLGEESAPLQTTKRMMTQSNYNPVLGKYPSRPPFAGNCVNPRASANFRAEAKRRTGPERLTGSRPMKIIGTKSLLSGDSVAANLTQYGSQPLDRVKLRTKLAQEHTSGHGVVDTFRMMEEWSEDVYMPNPPIKRLDGSGRTVSPRKRQTFNRILQKEYDDAAEAALQEREQNERNALKAERLAKGYNRQANYDIISIRDRTTGELVTQGDPIKRGVKKVMAIGSGGSLSGLLGANMPSVQSHDPNHPAVRYGAEDVSHIRGGAHISEEAMADQRRQISGANNLGKLVRYENDNIVNHEKSRQYEETGGF
eukprot:g3561.t1